MMPRPNQGDSLNRRTNYNRPVEYDVNQLDLQWFPKLQGILETKPYQSGSLKIVESYEAKPRFPASNDLESGNSIIKNYKGRAELKDEEQPLYPELNAEKSVDEIDYGVPKLGAKQKKLTAQPSTREEIRGRGFINVKELKRRLLDMNRKELEKLGISRNHLRAVLSRADANKTGTVEYEKFLETVSSYRLKTEQASKIKQIGTALAYAEEFTCSPPKLFIPIVTALELGFYLYHCIHFPSEHGMSITWHGPVPFCSVLIFNPYRRWEAWRYVTYMLVHIGISHFVFNMIMQILVGVFLEMEQVGWKGSFKVALVYMSGVIAGSLGQSLTEPGIYIAGASGGVYSLIAAHLSTLVLNWNEDNEIQTAKKVIQFGFVKWIRVVFIGILVTYDTVHQILGHIGYLEGDSNTSVMGHLCGALAGLTVGIAVLDNRKVETWECYVRWISLTIFILTLVFAVLWNIFANDWMCGPEEPYCLYPNPDYSVITDDLDNCPHYHA